MHPLPESDDEFDGLLRQADPIYNSDLSDRLGRLENNWAEHRRNDLTVTSRSTGNSGWIISVAAIILMLIGFATVLLQGVGDSPDLIAVVEPEPVLEVVPKAESPEVLVEPDIELGPTTPPPPRSPAADFMGRMLWQMRYNGRDVEPVRSTFFALSPLARQSIRDELGTWLDQWAIADLNNRPQLVEQWQTYRSLWLPMLIDATGTWQEINREQASIEVVVSDAGPKVESYLIRAASNPELRSIAWPLLCRNTPDERIGSLIEQIQSCDELQQMSIVLIERDTETATQCLSRIALSPKCRQVLQQIQIHWPSGHAVRCFQWLGERDPVHLEASVALLRLIPDNNLDRKLRDDAVAGRDPVMAVSLLLARDSQISKQFLLELQRDASIAPNFPSAFHRLRNWNTSSIPFTNPFQKVCESCVIQS